jgi:hypothetical protein
MKFIAMTIACLVIGGSVGAGLGLLHDNFVWFAEGMYTALSNPNFWR